ncbi:hypothetical protein [Alistipes onderdonkii]|jgi:hypothetical protein|uniref:hypothetical protein n=1 Tax=Alistipes onderdonkii TaxID=328813 RepID=UPI0012B50651|nr:hypothetical protein [Alistipes onderdonkii]UWN62111.1 hypothetical protein NQ559_00080 [Alistipes onderdonkii]
MKEHCFSYSDLPRRMDLVESVVVHSCSEDCLIHGVKSLRQGLQEYWETGVYPCDPVQRNSGEYYDEDSTTQVDPSTDFSLDKFERLEKIVEVVSERERKKHEDDLGVTPDEELKK